MAYRTATSRRLHALDFLRLDGGLNLSQIQERLGPDESPEMENLWWEDGALRSRPGQRTMNLVTTFGGTVSGTGYAVTEEPYQGGVFLHAGDGLYRWDGLENQDGQAVVTELRREVPAFVGTFFRYGDDLFYKNRGGFYRIADSDGTITVTDVAQSAFVPTTVINTDPFTGAGDLYQPENRLTGKKRVTFNAAVFRDRVDNLTGNGTQRIFSLGVTSDDGLHALTAVYANGTEVPSILYSVNLRTGLVTFTEAPANGAALAFQVEMNSPTYFLPVQDVDEIVEVKVDGRTLAAGTDYTVNLVYGAIYFTSAPPVSDPPVNNTVSVVYRKENPEAYGAVMQCGCAAVYGAGTQLCIVAGGSTVQPNAVFWSGNTDAGLDPSYWPLPYYNLVGDTQDRVTGFGKQYGDLIVFKAGSLGKLNWSVEDVEGRGTISLTYTRVNDRIGCDLPGTIQLVENNLVFCNTTGGVFRLRDASAALETGVVCLSGKVNGSDGRPGLLADLRAVSVGGAGNVPAASSNADIPAAAYDDGRRYCLAVGGHVWAWDYSISAWENPSWFYLTGFSETAGWFRREQDTLFLSRSGTVVALSRVLTDDGEPFPRVYQFPARNFGSYDRLKDVLTVIVALEGTIPGRTRLIYSTDYERRADLTPLVTAGNPSLSPRDLTERDLSASPTPAVFRRRPMCRHVRHFSMRLENDRAGEEMAILYAQIQMRFLGKDR